MRLRYLVTLKGTGKVNRKVSPRVIYIYIHIWQDLTKYVLERLTGQAVWY